MSNFIILFVTCLLIFCSTIQTQATVGTNAGGWMVLEPWITPTLFYRFLGKTVNEGVAMDSYTFCEVLGPDYGNQVMRAHWDTFFTEDDIKELAQKEVEMIRLPIGDWTLNPYGPYVGCMDGAEDKVQWFFDTCNKYGIQVLLDVHCMIDSQNGFDNSGKAFQVRWDDDYHFSHWPNQSSDWMGRFNLETYQYDYINHKNIEFSLKNSEDLLRRWGNHPAFAAFEPVNEPWDHSDLDVLFDFYRQTRALTQKYAPQAYFVFHDAFKFDAGLWNNLFDDTELIALDTHIYQAWNQGQYTTRDFCASYGFSASIADSVKYEVWVGEWSLATDVCAMWLGGFNDGNTDPQFKCQWLDCPYEYLPEEFQTPLDRSADILGPFGTANDPKDVCIQKGMCPQDSAHFNDSEVGEIARCALQAWNQHVDKQFLWTAKNEIEDRWSYVKSYDKGWINQSQFFQDNQNKEELNIE